MIGIVQAKVQGGEYGFVKCNLLVFFGLFFDDGHMVVEVSALEVIHIIPC